MVSVYAGIMDTFCIMCYSQMDTSRHGNFVSLQ